VKLRFIHFFAFKITQDRKETLTEQKCSILFGKEEKLHLVNDFRILANNHIM